MAETENLGDQAKRPIDKRSFEKLRADWSKLLLPDDAQLEAMVLSALLLGIAYAVTGVFLDWFSAAWSWAWALLLLVASFVGSAFFAGILDSVGGTWSKFLGWCLGMLALFGVLYGVHGAVLPTAALAGGGVVLELGLALNGRRKRLAQLAALRYERALIDAVVAFPADLLTTLSALAKAEVGDGQPGSTLSAAGSGEILPLLDRATHDLVDLEQSLEGWTGDSVLDANALWQRAQSTMKQLVERAPNLHRLALRAAESGASEDARQSFQDALRAAQALGDSLDRAAAAVLAYLARADASASAQLEEAVEHLQSTQAALEELEAELG
ncbi:MAG: hypothetical protein RBU37_24350 [Myxococcota bacterium]|jgi:hypothetical protein|nr:hypothetical protein [Myxococcota bacterium]